MSRLNNVPHSTVLPASGTPKQGFQPLVIQLAAAAAMPCMALTLRAPWAARMGLISLSLRKAIGGGLAAARRLHRICRGFQPYL